MEGLSKKVICMRLVSKLRMVYEIISIGFLTGKIFNRVKYAKQTLALL